MQQRRHQRHQQHQQHQRFTVTCSCFRLPKLTDGIANPLSCFTHRHPPPPHTHHQMQVLFNPRLRDSPRVDMVAPLKGHDTFVAPNAKVGLSLVAC